MTGRLPASAVSSLALHAGFAALYIMATKTGPAATTHMIGGVDLMIETHRPVELPKPSAAVKPPPTMLNFFKMALPAIPKIEAMQVQAKPMELAHKPLDVAPKLEDKGRKATAQLAKIDLGERHTDAAKIDLPGVSHRTAALAQMPRLEDVGVHKVRNLPAALALEEKRQAAVQQATIQGLSVPTHAHVAPAQMAKLLEEAQQPEQHSRIVQKFESMLPAEEHRAGMQSEVRPASDDMLKKMQQETKKSRRVEEAIVPSHKGVEIEGPLKNRQVVSADIPPFPEKLKQLGTPEAAVRLNFCVEPDGAVAGQTIKPDQSSGYGWLDRICMDSLRNWRFAPLGSDQRQCGRITFRFELE